MPIISEPEPRHICELPAPNAHTAGTKADCPACGRVWRLKALGAGTFKNWRPTLRTRLRNPGGRTDWATVRMTPRD